MLSPKWHGRGLRRSFTPHVFEVLKEAGVGSLIGFAYGFSSETELTDFLPSNGSSRWSRGGAMVEMGTSGCEKRNTSAKRVFDGPGSQGSIVASSRDKQFAHCPCFHVTLSLDGCLSWASGAIAEQATRHRGCSRPTSTRDVPSSLTLATQSCACAWTWRK